jgi:hypothetical protein
MRRRDIIGVIYGAALALPFGAAAQQPGKVWRIGDVEGGTPEISGIFARALEQSLADLGYVQVAISCCCIDLRVGGWTRWKKLSRHCSRRWTCWWSGAKEQ